MIRIFNVIKKKSKSGFALIELILVIAILSVLALILLPSINNYVNEARNAVDQTTVRYLNNMTTLYGISIETTPEDIFEGINTDEQRINTLIDEGYISSNTEPQHDENDFIWLVDNQIWVLSSDDEIIPLSPLGNTFGEISSEMIKIVNQNYINNGRYGRTWGDFAYTDIGLNPADWINPVNHIYYKPGGSRIAIRPEEGYNFYVKNVNGTSLTLTNRSSWNLVYNNLDQKWYYHSINVNNEIDISTLEIKP
jgi:prepilin-type N-terminal cleavage/methylation domain-containing protein